ncbi:MAG TPA: hypothetical protein VGK99_14130 [Acidobacteriota bacterium]|jgi:photosystem II stability/assembly factor-like uncharacterized protein
MKTFTEGRVLIMVLSILATGVGRISAGTNVWTSHGPDGGNIDLLVVDPKNPNTLYANASLRGLFKSTNSGESWTPLRISASALVIDPQNSNTVYAGDWERGILKSTDGGTNWADANFGLPKGQVSVLLVDPQNPSTVYAAIDSGVFKTMDGGASWRAANSSLIGDGKNKVMALAIDPLNSGTLYAGVEDRGIFKSTDGGTNWHLLFSDLHRAAVAIDPQNPSTLYAGTDNGIFKSTDGGESWVSLALPVKERFVTALVIDTQNPSTLYCAAVSVVFKTTDGGSSWTVVDRGLPVFALALAPGTQDSSTIYRGTWGSGVFKSADGGANWSAVNSGINATSITAVAVDPQNPSTVYAGTVQGGGVYKSTDGGAKWTASHGLRDTPLFLTVDPHSPGTVYAGTYNGIFKSTDGGTNWAELSLRGCSFFLVIDPQDPSTIYAGDFKSADGGRTWTKLDLPQGVHCLTALAIDPQSTSMLYAGDLENRVFKSADGGRNWSAVNSGLAPRGDYSIDTFSPGGIPSLTIDPQDSGTIYATASTIRSYEYTCAGVFKSTDGGRTWLQLGLPNSCLLAMDPQNPATLYAAAAYGYAGIFKSTDGGTSWSPVSLEGLTGSLFERPALAIDPQNPNRLFLGTFGGGVFEITFTSPVLTLDSTGYCVGDSWKLKMSDGLRNTSIRLLGTSNGQSWEIAEWRKTDTNGSFSLEGKFGEGTEGSYTLRVEIGGVLSNAISFVVSNCKQ